MVEVSEEERDSAGELLVGPDNNLTLNGKYLPMQNVFYVIWTVTFHPRSRLEVKLRLKVIRKQGFKCSCKTVFFSPMKFTKCGFRPYTGLPTL
jgi:hypothetical protein